VEGKYKTGATLEYKTMSLGRIVATAALCLMPLPATSFDLRDLLYGTKLFRIKMEPEKELAVVGQLNDTELREAIDMGVPVLEVIV
jgi:hypothetical protein